MEQPEQSAEDLIAAMQFEQQVLSLKNSIRELSMALAEAMQSAVEILRRDFARLRGEVV